MVSLLFTHLLFTSHNVFGAVDGFYNFVCKISKIMESNQVNRTVLAEKIPEGTESFSFQIAGHKPKSGKPCGVLKHKNGNLLKPLFEADRRSVTELSFYETAFQNGESDPLLKELKSFLPAFHGIWETTIAGKDMKYLSTEDICGTFQNPSILDLKIGRITYDKYATEEKIQEQVDKFKYGDAVGLRIVGMKTYDEGNSSYVTYDKMTFRPSNVEELPSLLGLYLSSNAQINIWFLSGFLHKLHQLDTWFSKQKYFSFIASSILFVHEGTSSLWFTWAQENHIPHLSELMSSTMTNSLELNNSTPHKYTSSNSEVNKICDICGQFESVCSKVVKSCPLFRIALIDFAHCHPCNEVDTNYIFGLRNTIDYFELLLKHQNDRLNTKSLPL